MIPREFRRSVEEVIRKIQKWVFQPSVDSVDYIVIKNAAGTVLLTFSTTTGKLALGPNAVLAAGDRLQLIDLANNEGIMLRGLATSDIIGIYLDNLDTGGRQYSMKSTGGGAAPGPGRLVFKDETDNINRFLIDNNGRYGYGLASGATPESLFHFKETYRLGANESDGDSAGLVAEPIYNNSSVATVTIDANGSGYQVNDVLTLIQSNFSGSDFTACTVRVDTVNGSGGVTAVTITAAGRGYTVGTKDTTVAPAGGTNCTIIISTLTAHTVTRHNYLDARNPTGSGAVTDAALARFNAAAGTHKAIDSGTTKTTPGTVDAWLKVNINGTIYYIPCYTSKTT